jgi:hypothetical protein
MSAETVEPKPKKPYTKKPGTYTAQVPAFVRDTVAGLSATSVEAPSFVIAAGVLALAKLDTPAQLDLIRQAKITYVDGVKSAA